MQQERIINWLWRWDYPSIIEKENNEQVIEASKRDVKAQLGHYYIYTNDKVYLFNTETGDYASRLRYGN